MTLAGLAVLLQSTGLPVTYRAWPIDDNENPPPAPPFICYLTNDTDVTFADGKVYYAFDHVRVELYTALKDPEAEAKVEQALEGFHWKKDETYLDTERCYMITYEIEV